MNTTKELPMRQLKACWRLRLKLKRSIQLAVVLILQILDLRVNLDQPHSPLLLSVLIQTNQYSWPVILWLAMTKMKWSPSLNKWMKSLLSFILLWRVQNSRNHLNTIFQNQFITNQLSPLMIRILERTNIWTPLKAFMMISLIPKSLCQHEEWYKNQDHACILHFRILCPGLTKE